MEDETFQKTNNTYIDYIMLIKGENKWKIHLKYRLKNMIINIFKS